MSRQYSISASAVAERARVKKLLDAGKCLRCRKANDRPERNTCTPCSIKECERRKLAYIQRKASNRCFRCTRPMPLGANTCEPCRLLARKYAQQLKKDAIHKYGDCCVMCGEARLGCLTLDHTDNNGYKHRKEIGLPEGTGSRFYRWLKDVNYECSYRLQVLCANCHMLKGGKYDD